ncbi:MAG: binding-protein-dependent transport systems inner membrane component [actinobacterium acAMD-5]|jgi:NitT/TauT family transport system permease protein|nr:MAG: binding-protein-dependent transport systems inner membrane component [actinobacterium acAMD-5]
MKEKLRNRPEIFLVPVVFIFVMWLWETLINRLEVKETILPTPSRIGEALIMQFQNAYFWQNAWVTTKEALYGFFFATLFAIIVGTFVSQIKIVEKTVMPYLVGFQAIPKVALAPIFIIWFGFGQTSKVVMAATIAFFPILINIIEGLKSADSDRIRMLRVFGATRYQIFRKVQVPSAMPFFFAGLDVGILLAILGAVVGEFLGSQEGLGNMVLVSQYNFETPTMFAILIVLSLMGIFAHIIVRAFQKKFAFWADNSHIVGT